jgi:hypothetical protein
MKINGDPVKPINDVVEITSLIIIEGDERKFIHKSVQEFHAALFVKALPDESAARFYTAMQDQWRGWMEELKFLQTIDAARCSSGFVIPSIRKLLNIQQKGDSFIPTDSVRQKIFGDDEVEFGENGNRIEIRVGNFSLHYKCGLSSMFINDQLKDGDWRDKYIQALLRPDPPGNGGKAQKFKVSELLSLPTFKSHLVPVFDEALADVFARLKAAEELVDRVSTQSSILDSLFTEGNRT